MIGLPILFWSGYASFGKGLVHILALGVFWTGFLKDLYSLPRPLSPPLHRITMSGSAALEYGFPSTHSANAVSVAVYALLILRSPGSTLSPAAKPLLEALSYFYALSIVFGRLYCGMHGFLDVVVGSLMGAAVACLEFHYGPSLDACMHSTSILAPLLAALVIVVLVRIHPEPADDCPCFDDSVAFAGVLIGLEFGTWSLARLPRDRWDAGRALATAPLGWPRLAARIVLGVLVIFAWRETMKPALLKSLPHLFRWIEHVGWSLPRRFFTPATKYKSVPPGSRLDTLFPTASDFPRMVESIRHPTTRGRSVSIGPQSAADAYETLAYRERRRRESVGSNHSVRSRSSNLELMHKEEDHSGNGARASGAQRLLAAHKCGRAAADDEVVRAPPRPVVDRDGQDDAYPLQESELEEKEMFSRLVRPRVRYDVEVVTKLVVYAGIGWIATAFMPAAFELVGPGTRQVR